MRSSPARSSWLGSVLSDLSVVQVYSIIPSSGDNFTKDNKQAGYDLIHLGMIGPALGVITVYSGFAEEYFAQLIIGIGFTMARTVSYTLLCSVTGAKFEQFHPSVLLFGLGYPCKEWDI